jgi:hypothetical protein
MADNRNNNQAREDEQEQEQNQDNEFLVADLHPIQLQTICNMCHIAANKRMSTRLECANIQVTGRYCRLIEGLKNVYENQQRQLELSRKYVHSFFAGRSIVRKEELERIYQENVVESERSLNEFINFVQLMGIEVVGI